MNKLVEVNTSNTFRNVVNFLGASKHLWESTVDAELKSDADGIRGLYIIVPPYHQALEIEGFQFKVLNVPNLEIIFPKTHKEILAGIGDDDYLIVLEFVRVEVEEEKEYEKIIIWDMLNKVASPDLNI